MAKSTKYYLQIATTSGVPIYRQIIDQVKTQVASGRLNPGDFLPSVRQVAKELEVNPMTVSKAYSLLERERVLEFVRGEGMRIQKSAIAVEHVKGQEESLVPLLREVINKSAQLSLRPEKVKELLESLWEEHKHG